MAKDKKKKRKAKDKAAEQPSSLSETTQSVAPIFSEQATRLESSDWSGLDPDDREPVTGRAVDMNEIWSDPNVRRDYAGL